MCKIRIKDFDQTFQATLQIKIIEYINCIYATDFSGDIFITALSSAGYYNPLSLYYNGRYTVYRYSCGSSDLPVS